ncbi:MAG: twin arginine-targeting protein translocase TatC [Candidatus Omnitrophica bacterium 4484_49]|nr:MAG: twin arginine-targeting protein translocase TatC [Candidatus Omnitrophica bacterium 4484_49]
MNTKGLTFLDHLEELRKRIVSIFVIFSLVFLVCLFRAEKILEWIKPHITYLIFIHPAEVIFVRLKVAFYSTVVICYPVVLYQIFRFLQPAIIRIKKSIFFFMCSFFLFVGSIFIYRYLAFPYILKFFLKFSVPGVTPHITLANYVSVFFMLFLIFVLLSQLPLLLVAGVYSGIIKQEFLRNRRREIYALSFILSAMLTPPDVLSQILLALPLISLLELSILISRFCVYNNKK